MSSGLGVCGMTGASIGINYLLSLCLSTLDIEDTPRQNPEGDGGTQARIQDLWKGGGAHREGRRRKALLGGSGEHGVNMIW